MHTTISNNKNKILWTKLLACSQFSLDLMSKEIRVFKILKIGSDFQVKSLNLRIRFMRKVFIISQMLKICCIWKVQRSGLWRKKVWGWLGGLIRRSVLRAWFKKSLNKFKCKWSPCQRYRSVCCSRWWKRSIVSLLLEWIAAFIWMKILLEWVVVCL